MRKILFIGAGFLQKFLIQKAKEIGNITLAVDANPNAVGYQYADKHATIDIIDQEACLRYAQEQNVDGVVTAATDFGVLTASYIAQKLHLPGLSYHTACQVKNKYLVHKRLFDSHADDAKRAYEVSTLNEIAGLEFQLDYPVMVKPCDGSGSRGASKVKCHKDLEDACRLALNQSLSHHAVIEPFYTGKEYGVESFVLEGCIYVLAIMKKRMTNAPYYAELGHIFPSGLPDSVEHKIKSSVEKAIKALAIDFGSVNMDLLLTDDGEIHIVDVGVRMGGNLIGSHIVPLGTGVDYMRMILCAATGNLDTVPHIGRKNAVATRLLALRPGQVMGLPDFREIENEFNVSIYQHLEIGTVINEYHTNLDGCGYVVATGSNASIAEQRAEAALRQIDAGIIRK